MKLDYTVADIERASKATPTDFDLPQNVQPQFDAVEKFFGPQISLALLLGGTPKTIFQLGLEMGLVMRQQQIDAEQANVLTPADEMEQELARIFEQEENTK